MKDRIIEMLERGERVDLECIDPDGFARHGHVNERLLSHGKMNIGGYYEGEFSLRLNDEELDSLNICRAQAYINDYELKYFKIKEPTHTFNDFIDAVVQAYKDGIIPSLHLESLGVRSVRFLDAQEFDQHDDYSCSIDHIKSLYTKTFVIESEGDLLSIAKDNEMVLLNGEIVKFKGLSKEDSDVKMYLFYYDSFKYIVSMPFIALKGATVTQKRG